MAKKTQTAAEPPRPITQSGVISAVSPKEEDLTSLSPEHLNQRLREIADRTRREQEPILVELKRRRILEAQVENQRRADQTARIIELAEPLLVLCPKHHAQCPGSDQKPYSGRIQGEGCTRCLLLDVVHQVGHRWLDPDWKFTLAVLQDPLEEV